MTPHATPASTTTTTADANLYPALRAQFPTDLDAPAIHLGPVDGAPTLTCTWRDLDLASARLANLLQDLELPSGSRVAMQAEKSVESLTLYLAVLHAGLVCLPLNTAYRSAELAHFLSDAEPAVLVCRRADFGGLSKLAFTHGMRHVYALDASTLRISLAARLFKSRRHR